LRVLHIIWHSSWTKLVIGAVIGVLLAELVVPFIRDLTRSPFAEITCPVEGDEVQWSRSGYTIHGTYGKLRDELNLYVLVHPKSTDKWWVQPKPTILDEKNWQASAYFGYEMAGVDEQYEFCVIITDRVLEANQQIELDCFPPVVAKDVVTVVRKREQAILTVTISPSGGGSVSPGGGHFDIGTSVDLRAHPSLSYRFDSWGGDASGTNTSATIVMDSDKHTIANFMRQYTVTIDFNGQGTTEPVTGTHVYDEGTLVTVTALPASGWEFECWGGDCSGVSPVVTITVYEDKNVMAYFRKPQAPTVRFIQPQDGNLVPQFIDVKFEVSGPISSGYKPWLVITDPIGQLWAWEVLPNPPGQTVSWIVRQAMIGVLHQDVGKEFYLTVVITDEEVEVGAPLSRMPGGPWGQVSVRRR